MSLLRRQDAASEDGALACPRDGSVLAKTTTNGIVVDRCGSCRGAWFDARELRRAADDREVEALASHVGKHPSASGFPCPRCHGTCVASFVGDVQVDTCTACHGVWLDAGELEEAKRQVGVNRVLTSAGPGFLAFLQRL